MRLIVPAVVVGLGVLVWLLLDDAPDERGGRDAVPAGAQVERGHRPPEGPPLDADLPPPDGTVDLKTVARIGLLGQSAEWLPGRMIAELGWTAVPDRPHTYKGFNDVELTWIVRGGRVVGARAWFAKAAYSAELKGLAPWLVGTQEPLDIHWETFDADDAVRPREGTVTTQRGRVLHYRGTLRSEGEPPFGPERFEISLKPFD